MKALFGFGADVPAARIVRDHRQWLLPVALVLGINILVLTLVVLPMRQSALSASSRAAASAEALQGAMAELKDAEGTRDGQAQASADLDQFYARVLPADLSSARRITHLKFARLARANDVSFQSGAATPEEVRNSTLERLHVTYELTGEWDDIRQLIYDLETGPDFIVIENVQLSEGAAADAPLSLSLELSTYYRIKGADGR